MNKHGTATLTADEFKKMRIYYKETQKQFAKRLRVSESTVSKIETGKMQISGKTEKMFFESCYPF